jgi:hypothetical protein
MRKIMFAVFLFCFVQSYAKTPIPEALVNAKTALVTSEGSEPKDFDKFCDLLKEWGRFELVQTRGKADIVIQLSVQLQTQMVRMPNTGGGFGGMNNQQVIVSFIHIFDSKDNSQLWTDSIQSKNPKNLVSNLKDKLKNK